MSLLRAAVNIDPNPSRGGGDIEVEDGIALLAETGPSGTNANIVARPPTPDQISLYIVDDGDTLSQIAKMFDVSVNTIVWANNLKSDTDIHEGETLIILPISGIQHAVEKGDTINSIAKEYGSDIDDFDAYFEELLTYNDLTKDTLLSVGDVVTIPGGEMHMPQASQSSYASVAAPTRSVTGYFISPLRSGTYKRTQGLHGYNAVDLGAPVGTPIRAAAAGDVIVAKNAGWNGGYGQYVVIRHSNGTQTLYAHMSRVAVWQGKRVVQGEVIGYVGSTGRSTGSHLHLEVRGAANPF